MTSTLRERDDMRRERDKLVVEYDVVIQQLSYFRYFLSLLSSLSLSLSLPLPLTPALFHSFLLSPLLLLKLINNTETKETLPDLLWYVKRKRREEIYG
jgi:hypothetical protein